MTINNGKTVILFVEPNFLGHTLIMRAKEKGHLPLVISSKANPHSLPEVGFSQYLIDTHNEEGVIDLVRKLNKNSILQVSSPAMEGVFSVVRSPFILTS